MLKENEAVIKVIKRKEAGPGFDNSKEYFFYVNLTKGDYNKDTIVLIDSNYKGKSNKKMVDRFNLTFCKIVDLITDSETEEEIAEYHSIFKPFVIMNIKIDDYFNEFKKIDKKQELEKTLRQATSKLEEISKFKMLAELNPAYQTLYDEYVKMCAEDTQALLPESNVEESETKVKSVDEN